MTWLKYSLHSTERDRRLAWLQALSLLIEMMCMRVDPPLFKNWLQSSNCYTCPALKRNLFLDCMSWVLEIKDIGTKESSNVLTKRLKVRGITSGLLTGFSNCWSMHIIHARCIQDSSGTYRKQISCTLWTSFFPSLWKYKKQEAILVCRKWSIWYPGPSKDFDWTSYNHIYGRCFDLCTLIISFPLWCIHLENCLYLRSYFLSLCGG